MAEFIACYCEEYYGEYSVDGNCAACSVHDISTTPRAIMDYLKSGLMHHKILMAMRERLGVGECISLC